MLERIGVVSLGRVGREIIKAVIKVSGKIGCEELWFYSRDQDKIRTFKEQLEMKGFCNNVSIVGTANLDELKRNTSLVFITSKASKPDSKLEQLIEERRADEPHIINDPRIEELPYTLPIFIDLGQRFRDYHGWIGIVSNPIDILVYIFALYSKSNKVFGCSHFDYFRANYFYENEFSQILEKDLGILDLKKQSEVYVVGPHRSDKTVIVSHKHFYVPNPDNIERVYRITGGIPISAYIAERCREHVDDVFKHGLDISEEVGPCFEDFLGRLSRGDIVEISVPVKSSEYFMPPNYNALWRELTEGNERPGASGWIFTFDKNSFKMVTPIHLTPLEVERFIHGYQNTTHIIELLEDDGFLERGNIEEFPLGGRIISFPDDLETTIDECRIFPTHQISQEKLNPLYRAIVYLTLIISTLFGVGFLVSEQIAKNESARTTHEKLIARLIEYAEWKVPEYKKIEEYKNKLHQFNQQLADRQSKVSLLEERIKEQNTVIKELQAKLKHLENFEKEANSYKTQINKLNKELEGLSRKRREDQQKLSKLKEEIQTYKTAIKRLEKTNRTLETKLTTKENSLNKALSKSESLTEEIKNYQKQLSELTLENKHFRKEAEKSKKELTDAGKELQKLRKTIAEFREEYAKLTRKFNKISRNLEAAVRDKKLLEDQVIILNRKIGSLEQKNKNISQKLIVYQTELKKAQRQITNLFNEKESLINKLAKKEKELNTSLNAYKKLKENYKKLKNDYSKALRILGLDNLSKNERKQYLILQAELDKLGEGIKIFRNSLEEFAKRVETDKKTIAIYSLRESIKNDEEELADMIYTSLINSKKKDSLVDKISNLAYWICVKMKELDKFTECDITNEARYEPMFNYRLQSNLVKLISKKLDLTTQTAKEKLIQKYKCACRDELAILSRLLQHPNADGKTYEILISATKPVDQVISLFSLTAKNDFCCKTKLPPGTYEIDLTSGPWKASEDESFVVFITGPKNTTKLELRKSVLANIFPEVKKYIFTIRKNGFVTSP